MTITLRKLKEQLKEIKEMGFIKTHRAHDTGIGKTLEDLLDIKENNLKLPDVGEVELKAKRIDSSSMLTIATKSPEPKGVNKFKSAVEGDKLKIDIRIGVYRSGENKGKYHDHGTGFRINKKDFLHLFDKLTQII